MRRGFSGALALLALHVVAGPASTAGNQGAADIVRKCGEAYRKLEALNVRSKLVMELAEPGRRARKMEVHSEVQAAKPNRFVVRFLDSDDARGELRSDGVKLITYRKEGNQYLQSTLPKSLGGKSLLQQPLRLSPGTSLVLNLLGANDPTEFLNANVSGSAVLASESLNGRRAHVIALRHPWEKLEPGLRGKTLAAVTGKTAELKLWIDERDGLLRQVRVDLAPAVSGISPQRAPTKFVLTETFSEVNVDPRREADNFAFKPPAGAKLVAKLAIAGPRELIGTPSPPLSLPDLKGKTVRLEDFKGRSVLLVSLWASTWGHCVRELPALHRIQQQLGRKGLTVIGIAGEDGDTARGTLQRAGATFLNLIDENGVAFRKLQAASVPRSFIIDRAGVIRADLRGAHTEAELREELARAGIR